MGYNKMNQSDGLSHNETMLLSYQKVPKVNIEVHTTISVKSLTSQKVEFNIFCCENIQWNLFLIILFIDNMITRIISLVFLFIIGIRFPRGKSIADIIRNRYSETYIKKIRMFKKYDFKLQKCHLDLRFLLDCKNDGVIPKFLLLN